MGNSTTSVCLACRSMWRKRSRRSKCCPMDRKSPSTKWRPDRPPLTKWAIRRTRLALRVAVCGGSVSGVRGAARWTASGRGEDGAGRITSRQCGSRPKEALRCHRHGSVRLIYGAGGHHGRRVDGVDGSTTMDRVAAGKLPTTERRDIAAQRDRRVSRPVARRAAPERRARARKHY